MKKTLLGITMMAGMMAFGMTDAEVQAMLDNQEYSKFAEFASVVQVTNLVKTSASAAGVLDAYLNVTNTSRAALVADLGLLAKEVVFSKIVSTKVDKNINLGFSYAGKFDDAFRVSCWRFALADDELMSIPTTIRHLSMLTRCGNQSRNPDLFKQTVEKIHVTCPEWYVYFIYNWFNKFKGFDEINTYAQELIQQITLAEAQANPNGWNDLRIYDSRVTKHWINRDDFISTEIIESTDVKWTRFISMLDTKVEVFADRAIKSHVNYITDPALAWEYAERTDKMYRKNGIKTDTITKQLYATIAKTPKCGVKAALFLNDNDKLVDCLLLVKDELNAKEINQFIPTINALDVNYRKDDVITILKNLNARYTTKLYNDRATWEPIIAKIRAMLDVRR